MKLTDFRKQNPEYNDLSDAELVEGLHKKFYSDIPFETFSKEIGFNKAEESSFLSKVGDAISERFDTRSLREKGLLQSQETDPNKTSKAVEGVPFREDYIQSLKQKDRKDPQSIEAMAGNNFGKRADGTVKGKGFLGELKRPDGNVSTELSIGVNLNGKEIEIPTLVPTLTQDEVNTMLNLKDGEQPPKSIVMKAVEFAKQRIANGKPVFADKSEQPNSATSRAAKSVIDTRSERDILDKNTNDAINPSQGYQPIDEMLTEKRKATQQAKVDKFNQTLKGASAYGNEDNALKQAVNANVTDDDIEQAILERSKSRMALDAGTPDTTFEIARNALARTAGNTTAMNKSFIALALDSVGLTEDALSLLESAEKSTELNYKYPSAIKDFTQIKSMSDVPTYLLEGAIENAGNMVQSIGIGAVGANVAKRVGADKLQSLVQEQAKKELAKRIAIGSAIGASASSIAMESGSIYQDIYEETGKMKPGVALSFGALAGALDAIPAARAVTQAMKNKVVGEIGETLVQRYGVETAKQIMAEGSTEFLQTWIESGALSFVDDRALFTKENLISATDAMLKGGGVGGVTNIAAQGFNDLTKPKGLLQSQQDVLKVGSEQTNAEDDAVAAQKQAAYDAEQKRYEQQTNADAAMAGISQATSVDDAILLATEAINTPLSEGLDATDLVDDTLLDQVQQFTGGDNVSNSTEQQVTEMATQATGTELDNQQGSARGLLPQSAERGLDNVTEPLGTSGTGDIQRGTDESGMGSEALGDIDALKAQLDKAEAEGDLEGMYNIGTQLTNAITQDTVQAINKGEMPVFKTGENSFITLSPSAQNEGKFQVTRYNKNGIMGDSQYNSIEQAISSEGVFNPRATPEQANELMKTSLNAEMEYNNRKLETAPVIDMQAFKEKREQSKTNKAVSEMETLSDTFKVSAIDKVKQMMPTQLADKFVRLNSESIEAGKTPAQLWFDLDTDADFLKNSVNKFLDGQANSKGKAWELSVTDQERALAKNYLENAPTLSSTNNNLTAKQKLAKRKKKKPKSNTLLAHLKSIGGISIRDKSEITGEKQRFALGGYNQIFRKDAKLGLQDLIDDGVLDDYLPFEMRASTSEAINPNQVYDSQQAYEYLADRIGRGDSVLPYEVELELQEKKINEQFIEEVANSDIGVRVDEDDLYFGIGISTNINALEQFLGISNEKTTDGGKTEQPIARSEESGSGNDIDAQETQARNEVTETLGSNEREGVRPIVEAIAKRRAAANQINKGKAFDTYLQAAKEFMAGEDIKPARFTLASTAFKNDAPLSEAYAQLAELAKQPAKQARKEKTDTVQGYRDLIANTNNVDSLKAIARDIQDETVLSDAQVQELDDLVMDKIDGLQVDEPNTQENEQEASTGKVSTVSPDNVTEVSDFIAMQYRETNSATSISGTDWNLVYDTINDNGNVRLISKTENTLVTFKYNPRSGTEAMKARAKALVWAEQNPNNKELPQGELVSKPLFESKQQDVAEPKTDVAENTFENIKAQYDAGEISVNEYLEAVKKENDKDLKVKLEQTTGNVTELNEQQFKNLKNKLLLAQRYATKRVMPDDTTMLNFIEDSIASYDKQVSVNPLRTTIAEMLDLKLEKVTVNGRIGLFFNVQSKHPILTKTIGEVLKANSFSEIVPATDFTLTQETNKAEGNTETVGTADSLKTITRRKELDNAQEALRKNPNSEVQKALVKQAEARLKDAINDQNSQFKGVTPQIVSKSQAEKFIAIASDSVNTLRKQDVFRVLDETPAPFKLSLGQYIKTNRKDLAQEVDDVLSEIQSPNTDNFTLQPETNAEILAREQAQKDAEAEKAKADAKAKAEEDKRALEAQQRKNANERPFVFGEDNKKVQQAVKSGSEDMFAGGDVRQGKVGDMLSGGEVVTTATGRNTTPFPEIKWENNRQATNTLKKIDAWLIENAILEAKARRDDFNLLQFEAINLKNISPADKDGAELYLFGDSIPPVYENLFKDITDTSSLPDNASFSVKKRTNTDDVRDMFAQHNISEEGLFNADKMGGLAVPSLAVTKADLPLQSFGEITLIAPKTLIDPKGRSGAKVFGADIYSPRYPEVTYKFDTKIIDAVNNSLKDSYEATDSRPIRANDLDRNAVRTLKDEIAVKHAFLKTVGEDATVIYKEQSAEQKAMLEHPALKPFVNGSTDPYDLTNNKDFVNAYFKYLKDKRKAEGTNTVEFDFEGKQNIVRMSGSYEFREAVNSNKREVDKPRTKNEFDKVIESKYMDDFNDYVQKLFNRMSPDEKLFEGYTYSGNRRYSPHTLANVVKKLKKNLRGGENWNYGLGSVRSKFTPEFKSIAEIKKNKDRIVSTDDFETVKAEQDAELFKLAETLSEYHDSSNAFAFLDTVTSTMSDAATMGVKRALEENQFKNVPIEIQQDFAEFLTKLRNMPSEYFEAKVTRAVGLNEFAGAVVPDKISKRALDILKRNGITNIYTYSQTKGNRPEVIKQALNDLKDDAMFSRVAMDTYKEHSIPPENVPVGDWNGRVLFHGTSDEGANSIQNDGVIIDKSTAGYFGKGFYVASDATLAASNYADMADDDGSVIAIKVNDNARILDLRNEKDFEKYKTVTKNLYLGSDELPSIMIKNGIDGLFDNSFGGLVIYNPKAIEVLPDAPAKFSNTPTFYSQLTRAISESKNNRAPASVWKAFIKNLAQKGVKPDEVEWTGINEWLDLQTGSVTKEQVLDYLDSNGVQVTETMMGSEGAFDPENYEDLPPEVQALIDQVDEGELDAYELYAEGKKIGYEIDVDMDGSINSVQRIGETFTPTKYSQYTVAGGENYKELLLTLPEAPVEIVWEKTIGTEGQDVYTARNRNDSSNTVQAVIIKDDVDYYSHVGLNPRFISSTLDGAKKETEDILKQKLTSPTKYRSSHFDQPNILAHVRFDERTDADGNKVLFINEIQSDWGQEGKKKGFKEQYQPKLPNITAKVLTGREFVAERSMPEAASKFWLDGRNAIRKDLGQAEITLDDKFTIIYENDIPTIIKDGEQNPVELAEKHKNRYEKMLQQGQANFEREQSSKVPTAPFVQKTDAWVALAIKRMMRYAAENGFDKVAFINGQQAADLYDLSKSLDRIDVERDAYGDKFLIGGFKNSKEVFGTVAEANDLPNVVGKELADKITNDVPQGFWGIKTYQGIDLKVGGEGMRTFYDNIVPKVANDVLKKLGGGKVERGFGDAMPKDLNAELQKVKLAQSKIKDALVGLDQSNWSSYSDMSAVDKLLDRVKSARTGAFTNKNIGNLQEKERASKLDEAEKQIREQLTPAVKEYMVVSQAYRDLLATPSEYLDTANLAFTITPEMREKVMGGLPLFSRQQAEPQIFTVQQVREAIKNDIYGQDVDVYESLEQAPQYIQDQARSERAYGVEGYFDKRTNRVALIANNLESLERAKEVARHELIGHYGIENMMTKPDFENVLDRIKIARRFDPQLKEIANYVLDNQQGLRITSQDTPEKRKSKEKRIAKEVIAVMAERNLQNNGIWQRIVDAVKVFLNKIGFIKGEITTNEISRLLRDSQRYLAKQGRSVVEGSESNLRTNASFSYDSRPARVQDIYGDQIKVKDRWYHQSIFSKKASEFEVGEIVPELSNNVPKRDYDLEVDSDLFRESGANVSHTPQKISKFVREMKKQGGWGNFPPIYGYVETVTQDDIDGTNGNVWSRELTQDDLGKQYVQVENGHNRAYAARELGINLRVVDGSEELNFSNKIPDTITVDGKQRPTLNSNGKPIHPTREGIENFWRWFGDSNMVASKGRPLVFYHGTKNNFDVFDTSVMGEQSSADTTGTISLTPSQSVANEYAQDNINVLELKKLSPNVMPVYVKGKIKIVDATGLTHDARYQKEQHDIAKKEGFEGVYFYGLKDGLVYDPMGIHTDTLQIFNPNQIKSAIGNTGSFDADNDSILFSNRNLNLQRDNTFESPQETVMTKVVRVLQDKNIDLKNVQKQIKENIGDIADRFNAYLQEELYHGRAAKRTKDFIEKELNPLITDMRVRGVKLADFEEYLWMRHAPERNAKMAEINEDAPDGLAGVSTQDALDYMANLPTREKNHYEALARKFDAIIAGTNNTLVAYQLESQATIDTWRATYQHYAPLMREEMENGTGNGTGQGFSVRGNSTKQATGSRRAVVDILANVAQARERAIIRGEKNRVATALIGLVKNHPNDDFWKADTPPTRKAVNPQTGFVENFTDPNYKNRDDVIVARIADRQGNIKERSVTFNKFDERAMNIARSLKNLDVDNMNAVLTVMAMGTRWISSVNTQYNPVFGLFNLWRDSQAVALNLSSTPLAGKQKEVLINGASALRGIFIDIRDNRKGVAPTSQWALLWEEFQREGGQTGYRDQFKNASERTKAIEHALDPQWWAKSKLGKALTLNGFATVPVQYTLDARFGAKAIFGLLSDYNETLENAMRLSTYKVALDNGMTKQQAASLAKNISVNFNRKGQAGRNAGALYAFFNASVQGTARLAETIVKDGKLSSMGKKVVYGGMLLGAIQALALKGAGFDDEEPPEFIKDRNIVIPVGDGKYVTWALPLGFNVFPATGRIGTEFVLDGFREPSKKAIHLMEVFMDMFNPIGNAGMSLQTLMPSVIDPAIALVENRDWNGMPIYKEDFNSLDETPGFTRTKDTATWYAKGLAYGFNALTGGDEDVSGKFSPTPDQIDYLVGQVTGGVGRELSKAEQTITSMVTDEELPTYKIPLVGRLYGDTKGAASQGNKYYANIMKMNRHKRKLDGMQERGEDTAQYLAENKEAGLVGVARSIDSTIGKLKRRRKILKENNATSQELREVNDRITELMTQLNTEVEEAR